MISILRRTTQHLRFLFILLLPALSTCILKAQVDAQFTYFNEYKSYINPAYAGVTENMNFTLANKMQWVGMPGAPKTFMLSLESPIPGIPKGHGVGLTALTEKIGMFSTTAVGLQYSYQRLNLPWGNLILGAQIGIINQSVDTSDKYLPSEGPFDPNDPNIPTGSEAQGLGFDAGIGLLYQYDDFSLGLSGAHIFSPTLEISDKIAVKVPSMWYLYSSYKFMTMEKNLAFEPSLLLKTDFQIFQPSFSIKGTWKEKLFAGLNYRWGESLGVMVGTQFDSFRIGYAYDILLSRLNIASSGSHELFLSYSMKLNFGPKTPKSPRKSVRNL